jgi:hypothetical protein
MESAARDDSAPADAADAAGNPFGFVIPEPLSMSSSDDESGVSEKEYLSQYRMEQMRKRGSDDSDDQSSSGDDNVEIPEDEIPPDDFVDGIEHVPRAILNKKAALKVDVNEMMRTMNKMSQHLQAVMRLQKQHHREKRLREGDQEVGDPGPATLAHRARAAEFTLPCKKQRGDVPPTPDSNDDDLESMSSHASSTSKTKYSPNFVLLISRTFANSAMRKFATGCEPMPLNK